MNFKKLNLYSLSEIFQLIKNSIGSRLVSGTPKGLRNTIGLVNFLISKGTKIEKEKDAIAFNYPINNNPYLFKLNRNSSDSLVFQQIIIHEEYKFIVEFFQKNNIQIEKVIDAGANIGMTSIYLNAYFPDAKIIALEPGEDAFFRLKNNIKNNKLKHVICLPKGLWSHHAFLSPDNSFRDGLDWAFRLIEKPDHHGAFEVVSVADLINEYKLDNIDFLKMDIEGGESVVFDEKADISWLQKVKVIAIEIHDEFNCRTTIESKLTAFGFSLSYSGELTIGINKKLLHLTA